MGEHKKPFTLRIDTDTKQQLVNLQDAFWPFCDDLSSAIRIAIRTSHALIFTPTKLREVFARLQRIQGVTLHDGAQLELNFGAASGDVDAPKKPLQRVQSPSTLGRRLAFQAASLRRNYRPDEAGMVQAYSTSFALKSTRIQGAAA